MSLQSQPPFQFANFFAYLNVPNHWKGRGFGCVQSFHMRVKIFLYYFLKMQYKLKTNSNNLSQKIITNFKISLKEALLLKMPISWRLLNSRRRLLVHFWQPKYLSLWGKFFHVWNLMKFKIVTKLCLSYLLLLSRQTSILYSFNLLYRRT